MSTNQQTPAAAINDDEQALLAELEALRREHAQLSDEWVAKDAKIEQLTAIAVKNQIAVEVEEEKMTNKLLKRLDEMKRNKQIAEERLRRETEEKATITSQVAEVHATLVEIENQIETEQNCILHKLQRELIDVSATKAQIQRDLTNERGEYLRLMRQTLDKIIEKNPGLDLLASPVMSPTLMTVAGGAEGGNPTDPMAFPRPGDGTAANAPMPVSVAQLQHELNGYLQQHVDAESLLTEEEMMCGMLSQMLARVHQEVNVDRDRLMALESGLQRVQADVAIAERRAAANAQQPQQQEQGILGLPNTVADQQQPPMSNMSDYGGGRGDDELSSYACSTVGVSVGGGSVMQPATGAASISTPGLVMPAGVQATTTRSSVVGVPLYSNANTRFSSTAATPNPTPALMSAPTSQNNFNRNAYGSGSHQQLVGSSTAGGGIGSGAEEDGLLPSGSFNEGSAGGILGGSGSAMVPVRTNSGAGAAVVTSATPQRPVPIVGGGGGGMYSSPAASTPHNSVLSDRSSRQNYPQQSATQQPATTTTTTRTSYARQPSPSVSSTTSSITALRDHTQYVLSNANHLSGAGGGGSSSTPHTPHRGGGGGGSIAGTGSMLGGSTLETPKQ